MNEVRLPFGLRNGQMISIDTVKRGLACKCICPKCNNKLVAVKADVYRHHFRHHIEGSSCVGARETALHLYAKQIICSELQLWLPDYYSWIKSDLGSITNALPEQRIWDIQPDVLLQYENNEQIAVEIYVAHLVPPEKIEKILQYNLATLEIDLSKHRDCDDPDTLKQAILFNAPREWLCPPLYIRLEIEREAERRLIAAKLEEEKKQKAREEAAEKHRINKLKAEEAAADAAAVAAHNWKLEQEILRRCALEREAARIAQKAVEEAEYVQELAERERIKQENELREAVKIQILNEQLKSSFDRALGENLKAYQDECKARGITG